MSRGVHLLCDLDLKSARSWSWPSGSAHRALRGVSSKASEPDGRDRTTSSLGRKSGKKDGICASGVSEGKVRVRVGKGGKEEMRRVVAIVRFNGYAIVCARVLVVVEFQAVSDSRQVGDTVREVRIPCRSHHVFGVLPVPISMYCD